jgi:hypothetical protein
VIRQRIRLPAQLGNHERDGDERGHDVDPPPWSAPSGDAQQDRGHDEER